MTDFINLRALALAATPGPWSNQIHPLSRRAVTTATTPIAETVGRQDNAEEANAAYIAAANPATVLALLDERDDWKRKATELTPDDRIALKIENDALTIKQLQDVLTAAREALIDTAASLAAAISLLEHTPLSKKAAPSNKIFAKMLKDYRKSLDRARTILARTEMELK